MQGQAVELGERADAVATGRDKWPLMRWLPLIPLAMAGLALAAEIDGLRFWPSIVVAIAIMISSILPLYGPLAPRDKSEKPDLGERYWRLRAQQIGLIASWLLMWAGVGYFAVVDEPSWRPTSDDWRVFMFTLLVIITSVPTLYASWARKPAGEGE